MYIFHPLKALRGSIVLLDFWATWCGPCRAAMPGIQELHETFRQRGVLVYGVSMDNGDPARLFAEERYTYGCLLDGDDVAQQYGVRAIPVFFLIGRDGTILFRQEGHGPETKATIAALIERHLKEAE